MDPNEITLSTPSKAFAFEKYARDLDKINRPRGTQKRS